MVLYQNKSLRNNLSLSDRYNEHKNSNDILDRIKIPPCTFQSLQKFVEIEVQRFLLFVTD